MAAPTEAGPEQAGPERAFAALALEEDPEEAELAARVAAREAEAAALRAPVAEWEAAVAEQEDAHGAAGEKRKAKKAEAVPVHPPHLALLMSECFGA